MIKETGDWGLGTGDWGLGRVVQLSDAPCSLSPCSINEKYFPRKDTSPKLLITVNY